MRINIPRVHGETPREKIIRSLLLVLVFAAVVWAFMENNQRLIERLNLDGAVYDETGTLTRDQQKFIVSFTKSLREEYGIDSKIQVFGGDFVVPELDGKTLYIGLAPPIKEVVISLPPMMRQSMGPGFTESLKDTFLLPSFEQGDWPMALQEVLMEIYNKLEALSKESENG